MFAVAWTYEPLQLANDLTGLRFNLLKHSVDLHRFHATEDQQHVRDRVVSTLTHRTGWAYAAIVIEKAKVNPSIRGESEFYPQFAAMVLRFVLKGCLRPDTRQVLIFTDELPVKRHKQAVKKAINRACRDVLPGSIRFDSYHHPCASNQWIQAADYCCWSVFKKWERGDTRTYDQLRSRLFKDELNVLARGTHLYY